MRGNFIMVRFSIIVVSIIFLGTDLTYSQTLEDFYEDAVNIMTDQLVDDFMNVSPPLQARRIDDINVVVVRNPYNLSFPFTVINGEQRHIFFTTGFLNLIYCYAVILLIEGEFDKENLTRRYFEYYFETVFIKKSKTAPLTPHRYFLSNSEIEVSGREMEAWLNSDQILQARNLMLLATIGVILAHEVGHHALNNLYSTNSTISDKKRSEEKTDEWAYATLYRLNENPTIGAIISAGILLELEHFQNKYSDGNLLRYHASPRTRAMNAWEIGCANQADENIKRVCDFLKSTIDRM